MKSKVLVPASAVIFWRLILRVINNYNWIRKDYIEIIWNIADSDICSEVVAF
jgi:hypothetical protein